MKKPKIIYLRDFRESDEEFLKMYFFKDEPFWKLEMYIEMYRKRTLFGRKFRSFVVCVGRTAVGLLLLMEKNGYIAHVLRMDIAEPFRKRGYGEAALWLACEYAKRKRYKVVFADLLEDFGEAPVRLFEKAGFLRLDEVLSKDGEKKTIYLKKL